MLRVVMELPSVKSLNLRTSFHHIRGAEDFKLLKSSSRLVTLCLEGVGCRRDGQALQRHMILAELSSALPNLQFLELRYYPYSKCDLSWYQDSYREQNTMQMPALEALTVLSYDISKNWLQTFLIGSRRAGVKTLVMAGCTGFFSPSSSLWSLLTSQTTGLGVCNPGYQSVNGRINLQDLHAVMSQLPHLKMLSLQDFRIPVYYVLPTLRPIGKSLRILQLHNHPLIKQLVSSEVDEDSEASTMDKAEDQVAFLIRLRQICPILSRLSIDLSSDFFEDKEDNMNSVMKFAKPEDDVLQARGEERVQDLIKNVFQTLHCLQDLRIGVKLDPTRWTRDFAVRIARTLWAPKLETLDVFASTDHPRVADTVYRVEEFRTATQMQPWWVIKRTSNIGRGDVRPEELWVGCRIWPEDLA